jgi:hypothetical protein
MKYSLGMNHNENYTFRVLVSSTDNANAVNRSTSISISFMGPKADDKVPDEMKASGCEKLDIDSS